MSSSWLHIRFNEIEESIVLDFEQCVIPLYFPSLEPNFILSGKYSLISSKTKYLNRYFDFYVLPKKFCCIFFYNLILLHNFIENFLSSICIVLIVIITFPKMLKNFSQLTFLFFYYYFIVCLFQDGDLLFLSYPLLL